MKSVMGFEFEADDAGKIKDDNTSLRILADLQEKGIAKISQSGYMCLPNCFLELEGEYWILYKNDRESEVVLVVHEISAVYEN